MILKKAINRLAWRFNGGGFKPNEQDIKAINDVITWINNQKEESIKNNRLFTKLYIYHLNKVLNDYDATIFDEIPQKELSALLAKPLSAFYLAFKQSFDDKTRESIFKRNNIVLNHLEQSEQNKINIQKMSDDDIRELVREKYDLFKIEEELKEMASEALNRFSKYD